MNSTGLIMVSLLIIIVLLVPYFMNYNKNLNRIKGVKTGDGQYGDAQFASKKELKDHFIRIEFKPEQWRNGLELPTVEGTIIGTEKIGKKYYILVDPSDNHTLIVSASGGGKTTSFVEPMIEYCAAAGMSVFSTDTKGNIYQDFAPVLRKYYHITPYLIDLRYPQASNSYNFLYLINKYYDSYKLTGNLGSAALAENYAKDMAYAIIHMDGLTNAGQNQFFYTAGEGVIAGITLLVSELCEPSERHIASVFKCIRQLMEVDPSTLNKKNEQPTLYITELYLMLPEDHTAKNLLAPTATTEFKTIASVMSTAMSLLLKFIDKEMEQILCFDDGFNIDDFTAGNSFIFFIIDEKSKAKNFMVNLILNQIYGELLRKAEEYQDIRLPHRIYQILDECGTFGKIDGLARMLSAGRSRNIISVLPIQNLSQLDVSYGKDDATNIKSNCQNTMFSYLSSGSSDASTFSKALGTSTVQVGSVSSQTSNNRSSSSITKSMTKKNLMSPERITRMPKGNWVLMKSGMNPSQQKLIPAGEMGVEFSEKYKIEPKAIRTVKYADRAELFEKIQEYYSAKSAKSSNADKKQVSVDYL